jgi:hypothetical protein
MPGSSIAAPSALGWVTDFLNAAYFARPPQARSVDDLRLAFSVVRRRRCRPGPARARHRVPDRRAARALRARSAAAPRRAGRGDRAAERRPALVDVPRTFEIEIEIVAVPVPRAHVFTRGYVTATRVLEAGPPLDDLVATLTAGVKATVVPDGGRALFGLERSMLVQLALAAPADPAF